MLLSSRGEAFHVIEGAEELRDDVDLECEVAIVGAGPAGLTLARELSAQGIESIVLEAGGEGVERPSEAGEQGSPFGVYSLARTRARGLGGTSQIFLPGGWRARPLDAIDFEARAATGDVGWPFGYEELEPYYRRADRAVGLGSKGYEASTWTEHETPLPPDLAGGPVAASVFQFPRPEVFGERARECARDPLTRIVLRAVVTGIEGHVASGRIDGLQIRKRRGGGFRVRAQVYVLAAGGIDNARLLLQAATQGSVSDNGLIGRFFMEHLHVNSGVFQPEPSAGASYLGFFEQHRSPRGGTIQGVLRLVGDELRRAGLPNALIRLHPLPIASASAGGRSADEILRRLRMRRWPEHLLGHLANCVREWRQMASRVRGKLAGERAPDRAAVLAIEAEHGAHRDSRVVLARRRDAFGMPVPRLEWRTPRGDLEAIRRTQELVGAHLERRGIGRIGSLLGDERPPARMGGGGHHMGTTRMHPEAGRGVVDPHGNVFGSENLFVAGSSVFPSAGASNPTLTIVALAIRLADTLARRLRPGIVLGGGVEAE